MSTDMEPLQGRTGSSAKDLRPVFDVGDLQFIKVRVFGSMQCKRRPHLAVIPRPQTLRG